MTTTDTTDPWCDENDTSIAVGDWVLVDDARGNPTIPCPDDGGADPAGCRDPRRGGRP